MKTFILTTALTTSILLAGLISPAQITLTEDDIPKVGTNYIKGLDDDPLGIDPGTPGEDKTWNFTSLVSDDSIGYSYSNPLATPYPSLFPEANLALHTTDTAYSFFHHDEDIYDLEGMAIQIQGEDYVFDYIPDMILLNFPFTYGDEIAQDYFFEYIFTGSGDSVRIKNHVSKWIEADAWGSVTLPTGTFDALRLSVIQEAKDSTWAQVGGNWLLIATTNSTTNFYDFYTNDANVDILLISLTYDQSWTVPERANYFIDSYVEVKELPDGSNMTIHPNPCADVFYIEGDFLSGSKLQLMNMSGKVVLERDITSGKEEVSISDIGAGTYVCRILDGRSAVVHREKVVIGR